MTPQVSLIEGDSELVYSGDLPHDFDIKFKLDESTGKLYIVIGELTMEIGILKDATQAPQCDYQMVDLGLPSGIKWADRNVGAATPKDYGMYFSWGNTKGVLYELTNMSVVEVAYKALILDGMSHSEIISQVEQLKQQYGENWEQVVLQMLTEYGLRNFFEGTTFDWENTPYYSGTTTDTNGNTVYLFSKYNDADGLRTLEEMDDAATANMGSDWRMPTRDEINELINNTDQYGVKDNGDEVPRSAMTSEDTYIGMKFVSKAEGNDNSIFIPFAGLCPGGLLNLEGLLGNVWSSSVGSGSNARVLVVGSGGRVDGDVSNGRFCGQSVRGVVG